MRLYYDGIWQPEQQVSDATGPINLSCPFVVPASHGNFAYCMYSDDAGGHLAVVEIDVGVTYLDIDRAIKQYKDGQIPIEDVFQLIERYFQN